MVTGSQGTGEDWVETRFREDDHPEWKKTFSAVVRRSLVDEDLAAGHTISAVLMAIVTVGLGLTIFAIVMMRR
jgi:hypothetical protein